MLCCQNLPWRVTFESVNQVHLIDSLNPSSRTQLATLMRFNSGFMSKKGFSSPHPLSINIKKYALGFTNKCITWTEIDRITKRAFRGIVKHKVCYKTSKYSVLTNSISTTIQEHVRKVMLSMERSALFYCYFVEEIATLSIQLSMLIDLLILRLLRAQWMAQSSLTSFSCKWLANSNALRLFSVCLSGRFWPFILPFLNFLTGVVV